MAARLATSLAALVDAISRRHGGRPIQWLGDGGLLYFEETGAAVLAALEMSEVLTTREAVEQVDLPSIRFEPIGPVKLQGLAAPLAVSRAVRDGGSAAS